MFVSFYSKFRHLSNQQPQFPKGGYFNVWHSFIDVLSIFLQHSAFNTRVSELITNLSLCQWILTKQLQCFVEFHYLTAVNHSLRSLEFYSRVGSILRHCSVSSADWAMSSNARKQCSLTARKVKGQGQICYFCLTCRTR